jgi:hypothetical protein
MHLKCSILKLLNDFNTLHSLHFPHVHIIFNNFSPQVDIIIYYIPYTIAQYKQHDHFISPKTNNNALEMSFVDYMVHFIDTLHAKDKDLLPIFPNT